jgi:chromosome segregation ATPase
MAQVLPRAEREMMAHVIRYNHEQQKAKQEKQELITLRTEVQQQAQTIDTQKKIIEDLTSKNGRCEQHITQLLEQNKNLRADNTTLRQKNTETDRVNFQLRIAYDELNDIYSKNLQTLYILQNSLTRS